MRDNTNLRVAVVVASLGRPAELDLLLKKLSAQTVTPAAIVLSVTAAEDLPEQAASRAQIVIDAAGSAPQRNRGLEAVLDKCDVVAFFDDDYVPSRYAIERIAEFYLQNPDVCGANGLLLADGVNLGGISAEEAVKLIDAYDQGPRPEPGELFPLPDGLYGCNMTFRTSAIGDVRFDEKLPLYAWQEDLDFSVALGRRGKLVKTHAFAGVHCGVTRSRAPGLRLGYSQIANPVYLVRKGTMRLRFALSIMSRNLCANLLRCFAPEPWIDRKGRLAGNLLALRDLAFGRLAPDKILAL